MDFQHLKCYIAVTISFGKLYPKIQLKLFELGGKA
jgi:hypothetical protein